MHPDPNPPAQPDTTPNLLDLVADRIASQIASRMPESAAPTASVGESGSPQPAPLQPLLASTTTTTAAPSLDWRTITPEQFGSLSAEQQDHIAGQMMADELAKSGGAVVALNTPGGP